MHPQVIRDSLDRVQSGYGFDLHLRTRLDVPLPEESGNDSTHGGVDIGSSSVVMLRSSQVVLR